MLAMPSRPQLRHLHESVVRSRLSVACLPSANPGHNAFADAEQRIASPGDVAGHADVIAHNDGGTRTSRLTSWSTGWAVAEGLTGKNSLILQTIVEEMLGRGVNILESPDFSRRARLSCEGRVSSLQLTQP